MGVGSRLKARDQFFNRFRGYRETTAQLWTDRS